MSQYRVYQSNSVLTTVADEDLDRAALGRGPLSTELANAAGLAGRRDLGPRLLESLAAPVRLQKLAAAHALLELRDKEACASLEARAATEADAVVRAMFTLISLRLKGIEAVRGAFFDEANPRLASLVASMYGRLRALDERDTAFLVEVLDAYLYRRCAWIKAEPEQEWANAVFLLLMAIEHANTSSLLSHPARAALRAALVVVPSTPADSESQEMAQRLLASLSTPTG